MTPEAWAAVALAAVGVLTLGWWVYHALVLTRAHLRVEVRHASLLFEENEYQLIVVRAINNGGQPTRLSSLNLVVGRRWRWYSRFLPSQRRNRFPHIFSQSSSDALEEFSADTPSTLAVGEDATVFVRWDSLLELVGKDIGSWPAQGEATTPVRVFRSRARQLGDAPPKQGGLGTDAAMLIMAPPKWPSRRGLIDFLRRNHR